MIYQGEELLLQIQLAELLGRGGADFPVAKKWRRIQASSKPLKYVVCNASEGEPGVSKDWHLLQQHPSQVLAGMALAMNFIGTRAGYLGINRLYWEQLQPTLEPVLATIKDKGLDIEVFVEEPSYIGGESSAMLNAIEGKPTEPRAKRPSPSLLGIRGCPTLVHNVETLYDVYRVATGEFDYTRLCTIAELPGVSGEATTLAQPGVYRVDKQASIQHILEQTGNWPLPAGAFLQVGGGASGVVINLEQAAAAKLSGCGSITVFAAGTTTYQFLRQLFVFYARESCGKCMPCFKGSAQLAELIQSLQEGDEIPWSEISAIVKDMGRGSFCNLGTSIVLPVRSYANNILNLVL